ncbi:MAG: hypothetical protein LBK83_16675 [Treponema sp.]|jgi:hypothetical protein|nr:hypothetical protein [Treponema sp.]
MTEVTFDVLEMPLIIFDSDKWKDNDEYINVANKIINIIKENDFALFFIQNKAYTIGDTEFNPIVMVNREDWGGGKGTLELYIKDIVFDLIPPDFD